jgi:hypothetical protein
MYVDLECEFGIAPNENTEDHHLFDVNDLKVTANAWQRISILLGHTFKKNKGPKLIRLGDDPTKKKKKYRGKITYEDMAAQAVAVPDPLLSATTAAYQQEYTASVFPDTTSLPSWASVTNESTTDEIDSSGDGDT